MNYLPNIYYFEILRRGGIKASIWKFTSINSNLIKTGYLNNFINLFNIYQKNLKMHISWSNNLHPKRFLGLKIFFCEGIRRQNIILIKFKIIIKF